MDARGASGRDGGRALFTAAGAIPVAALCAVFVLPYGAAIRDGFSGLPAALADPAIRRVVGFTVVQAALSTAATLVLGLPGAWILGSGKFRGARALRALSSIPFAMPPILVVLGFVLFFGNAGWANRALMGLSGSTEPVLSILYRPQAIILAHAFYNFPIVLNMVGDSFFKARSAYGPVASSLGASGPTFFRTVLLPISAPAIAAAALLVFLYCFTSFAVVLVLGGGPAATTLPVEIYRAARISLDIPSAGSLALIETSVAVLAYAAYAAADRRAARLAGQGDDRARERGTEAPKGATTGMRIAAGLYFALVAVLILGPILSVFAESGLSRSKSAALPTPTLKWWAQLGQSALPALVRSVFLAAGAATLSVALATLAALSAWGTRAYGTGRAGNRAFRSAVSAFCIAPVASSGIVLGFGWLRFYGPSLARSIWAVALAHAVSALPFAYRAISEGFRSLPERTANASAVLGAAPGATALRVALPAAASRIRSAWAFSAAISLGELNAVLMLGLDGYETLPMLVYRAAGSYRFGAACAAGVLLALSCALAFALSDMGEKRNVG